MPGSFDCTAEVLVVLLPSQFVLPLLELQAQLLQAACGWVWPGGRPPIQSWLQSRLRLQCSVRT